MSAAPWSVYLVRTADDRLYTGISTDPERRLREHSGSARGARSLRGRGPLVLVFCHGAGDRSTALRLEAAVKRLDRPAKERLVRGELAIETLLAPSGARPAPACAEIVEADGVETDGVEADVVVEGGGA